MGKNSLPLVLPILPSFLLKFHPSFLLQVTSFGCVRKTQYSDVRSALQKTDTRYRQCSQRLCKLREVSSTIDTPLIWTIESR